MNTTMYHKLVNQNQLKHFGATLQYNPYSHYPLYIDSPDRDFVLPLIVEGTSILAHARKPTGEYLSTYRHIVLSSKHECNPNRVKFPKALQSVEEEIEYTRSIASIGSPVDSVLYDNDDKHYNIRGYQRRLIGTVKGTSAVKVKISEIALDNVPTPSTFVSKERHLAVMATELSEQWLVGLDQATVTLKSTKQKIIRSVVLTLGRRYKYYRLYNLPRLP